MSTKLFDLTGKIALVTGASRGIGEAIAKLLAEQGAHVIVSSRKIDDCTKIATSICDAGGSAEALACHVGNMDDIYATFEHIRSTHGRLDICVNNAAANPYFGILATADRLVVTGDSIAMLSEACATGRPVQIFDLGGMRGESEVATDFRVGATAYAGLMRWCWQRLSRDITLVHSQLRATSRAFWLDEETGASVVPGETDMERAVAAVKGLLGQP